jgi:hypothetical protein
LIQFLRHYWAWSPSLGKFWVRCYGLRL